MKLVSRRPFVRLMTSVFEVGIDNISLENYSLTVTFISQSRFSLQDLVSFGEITFGKIWITLCPFGVIPFCVGVHSTMFTSRS